MKTLQELENFYHMMHPAQENTEEAFAWFTGLPHPLFNAVMHLKEEKKIDHFIAPHISFWVEGENALSAALKKRGFQAVMSCPLMTWQTASLPAPNQTIAPADAEFHSIVAKTFQFDQTVKEGFAKLVANVEAENYLIYAEGKPVGTGTLIPNGKTGGIFNLAVLPEYQRRGLGRAMMQFLMHRAAKLHLEKVVLLSSPIAEKLYASLGFTKSTALDIYISL